MPIAVTTLVAVAIIGVFSASAAGGSVHPLPSPSPSPSSSSRPTATPSPTPAATVEVPALSGTLTDAEAALNACGLAVGHITKVPSNQPASTVLGQTPRTGTAVVVGSRVDVRIASGSNVVPDVTNLTVADALARLRAAGFQAAGPADYPDDALVTGSRPAANVLFPLGATVLVTVVGQDGGLRSPTPSESPSG